MGSNLQCSCLLLRTALLAVLLMCALPHSAGTQEQLARLVVLMCRFCCEAVALKYRCTYACQRARAGCHLRSKPREPAVWPQRCVSGAYERRDHSPHQHSISHPGSHHRGSPGSHSCADSRDTGRCSPTGSRGSTGAAGRSQPPCRCTTHRLCTGAAALGSTDRASACASDAKPNCTCTCACTGTLRGFCTSAHAQIMPERPGKLALLACR